MRFRWKDESNLLLRVSSPKKCFYRQAATDVDSACNRDKRLALQSDELNKNTLGQTAESENETTTSPTEAKPTETDRPPLLHVCLAATLDSELCLRGLRQIERRS